MTYLLLALWGFLVYSNTFTFSFVFDDFPAIVNNPAIHHLDLWKLWQVFNTRLVVGITLAFNYALGQENVVGYHVFNLVVHILNSYFVYQWVCLTFKTPRMSKSALDPGLMGFLTALIFLTHPLQTQGVTYIWQRTTSLASFFYIGALVFYIRARLKSSWVNYGLCLLFTVLGMFTKEIVFTLPLMIVLYEVMFFKNRKFLLLVPILLMLFLIPWGITRTNEHTLKFLRYNNTHTLLGMTRTASPEKMPRKDFILTELNVLRTYLRLFILPVKQSVDYDYPRARSLLEPNTFLSFLLLLSLAGLGVLFLKKYPLLSFSIFWFFLTVSVECLVAQEEFIFEHRMYLPMVGVSLFLVMGLGYLFKEKPRRLLILMLGVVACCSWLTYQRNFVWAGEFSLWDDAIHQFPRKARAYSGRGDALVKKGLLDEALADYNTAIELRPHFLTYDIRGCVYGMKGLPDEALLDFNQAIELSPTFAGAYYNRANLYFLKKEYDKSWRDVAKAQSLGFRVKPQWLEKLKKASGGKE